VDWNKEMGIDVESVLRESPTHPEQVKRRKAWEQQAKLYWAFRLVEESSRRGGPVPKDPVKRQKRAKSYEFEDWQLRVAMLSLRRASHG